MAIKLGSSDIAKVYLGATEVDKIYLGATEIYSSFTPIAEYQAVLDYATTQGYTLPSGGQQVLQNNLIIALKSAGVWAKLDTFCVWATDGDSDFALVDWIRLSNYTAVNSPTFTSNQGYAGNGTTSYIDSNFNPSVSGVNYVDGDLSFGWHMGAFGTGQIAFAAAVSGDANWVRLGVKRFYYRGVSFKPYSGFTEAANQTVMATGDATELRIYANGLVTETLPISVIPFAPNITFKAFYQTFTTAYSNYQLSMTYAGGVITATQAADFNTAWDTYLASI